MMSIMAGTSTFLAACSDRPNAHHVVTNARNGAVLASALRVALSSADRRRGLLGRDRLPPGEGLALAPCMSVHTWFMRFPIDVLFSAKDGRVLKIYDSMPAWRLAAAPRAFATIELPAGTAAATDTREGDILVVTSLARGSGGSEGSGGSGSSESPKPS